VATRKKNQKSYSKETCEKIIYSCINNKEVVMYKKKPNSKNSKQVKYPKAKKGGFKKPSLKKPSSYKYKEI